MDEVSDKLPFDATKLFEALQYQLVIALEHCYKLKKEQRLWVEIYGDVTLEGAAQVEVKLYNKDLTDSHPNIWNTLKNWLHKDFDHAAYERLVLMTNQPFSAKSTLTEWNRSTSAERFDLLKAIHDGAEAKFTKAGKKEPSESLALQREVMAAGLRKDLMEVLQRAVIITQSPSLGQRIDDFKNEHLKMIRESKHQHFLDDLLGFISSTKFIESRWEITCEEFSNKVTELTKRYMKHSNVFPLVDTEALKKEVVIEDFVGRPFMRKIREIGGENRLRTAAYHLLVADAVIDEMFKDGLAFKFDVDRYKQNHLLRHLDGRELAMLECGARCPEALKKESMKFLLLRHQLEVLQFGEFEDTTVEFRNGIYHMLADTEPVDEEDDFLWRLWP